jgi:diguanylate cyclase (GGDEF)-like protein
MDNEALGVLLISDDEESARSVGAILHEHDEFDSPLFELKWAKTFWDALAHLAGNPVHVVLADTTSDQNGDLDVINGVKAVGQDIPIVALTDGGKTGRDLQNDVQDCLPKRHLTRLLLCRSLKYAVDRQQLEDRISHVASRDALTGIPNRAAFLRHVEQSLARGEHEFGYSFGLMFLDLDHFHKVNDSLGHECGDELLIEFSRRLQRCVRAGDVVARFGSDEFTILLNDVDEPNIAVEVADRIQDEMQTPIMVDGQQVVATTSIGICLSKIGYEDAGGMLRDANTAMHSVKTNGRARHQVFDRTMRDLAVARLNIEKDLRWAVDHEVFRLVYQPVVRLDQCRITGFEALVRLDHPDRGVVSPAEFIPLAEETGLIIPIGRWVIREACRQLRDWHAQFPADPPLSLSINLSSKELSQSDLVSYIDDAIAEFGIDPRCLDLEITESAIIENDEVATGVFQELVARGIRLSIDDFGMGYSSLSYLHRFAFDTLKIDRSFVDRLGHAHEDSDAFVRTIVALGKNLGMEVVAEGIETKEQLSRLAQLQCEYGQGYLFSKPVETDSVYSLLDPDFIRNLRSVCAEAQKREPDQETGLLRETINESLLAQGEGQCDAVATELAPASGIPP